MLTFQPHFGKWRVKPRIRNPPLAADGGKW
jgi:hypothetical protein